MKWDDILIKGLIEGEIDKDKIQKINDRTFYISGECSYSYLKEKCDLKFQNPIMSEEDIKIGIEIIIDDKILTIKRNIVIMYREYVEIFKSNNYSLIREAGSGYLISFIVANTQASREMLLNNLLCKYRGSLQMPSSLLEETKKINYQFKRRLNPIENTRVYIEKVVGTEHDSYKGYSWYEIFLGLNRNATTFDTILGDESIDILTNNKFQYEKISFIKVDDEYFVDEGNHRTVISKIIGIEYIDNCHVSVFETDTKYSNLYEKIKQLGFNVEPELIIKDWCSYKHKKTEYEWEIFGIKLDDEKRISLYGLEEIEFFITYIHNLNIYRFYVEKFLKFMKDIRKDYKDRNNIKDFIIDNYSCIRQIVDKK